MSDPINQPDQAWPPPVYQAQPPGLPYERDSEHLRLLSLFYYIWGGLVILCSCYFIFYIVMGSTMATMMNSPQFHKTPAQPGFPPAFGNLFAVIGIVCLATGWFLGGLTLFAGYCLARHKHPLLITITAALNCLSIPFGTLLGVFTFIVTTRPTVKAMFV